MLYFIVKVEVYTSDCEGSKFKVNTGSESDFSFLHTSALAIRLTDYQLHVKL